MLRRARKQIVEEAKSALAEHGDDLRVEIFVFLTPEFRNANCSGKELVSCVFDFKVADHRLQIRDHGAEENYCVVTVGIPNQRKRRSVDRKFTIDARPSALDMMQEAIYGRGQ